MEVGGHAPIRVQSMTNTETHHVESTVAQIKELEDVGCEIVRVAVPDKRAADVLHAIKSSVNVPIIADIHFDHKLALKAIESGVDGLRINPGNIGSQEKVIRVVESAGKHGIPIRVGVNAGSLEKKLKSKQGHATPEAMVQSAMNQVELLEKLGFERIKVSLKASDIETTVEACRLFSKIRNYPLHVGITEAGGPISGMVKSALGIGSLLKDGIGDTIRVSLTASPALEVKVAWEILKSLNLRSRGPRVISCPTCGRMRINLVQLVQQAEETLAKIQTPLTVAIMGCIVNGPGEAKTADVGIVGGKGEGVLYIKGKPIRKYPENQLLEILLKTIKSIAEESSPPA